MAIAIAGLGGCWAGPQAEVNEPGFRTSPAGQAACGSPLEEDRRSPELVLDMPARSSSADEAANLRARCRDERPTARRYRFTPQRTATYRFRLRADEPAALSISTVSSNGSDGQSLASSGEGPSDLRVTLREGETYAAVAWLRRPIERAPEPPPPPPAPPPLSTPPVDVHEARMAAAEAAEPPDPPPPAPPPAPPLPVSMLDLVVQLDESADARIRAEDPTLAAQLIAGAPRLGRRALGTFESVPGGPRARCGGLGGGSVYTVDVAARGTLALHVVAQFPVALEVRDRSGGSRGCARGEADPFEVSLAAPLPAGAYVVIVDATALTPGLLGQPHDVTVPGAGVRGGFVLDAEVSP
ncbi:MAG TPA: hypothetical protein VHW23_29465 [Kofleriaceae bacterium]|nr:hypothetical protein [Kofleriaceae bacterium]